MMKKSIRKKIACIFIAVSALILVAIGVFQYFFIDDFYLQNKQKKLLSSWDMMAEMSNSGSNDGTGKETQVSDDFEKFCSVNGLTYVLTDSQLTCLATNSTNDITMTGRLIGIVLGKEDMHTSIIKENTSYKMIRMQDRFSGMDYLELWGVLDNGNYYLVTCPIESISGAASVSMRFYVYVGLIAVAAGAVIIWLVTRRVVEPLQELSALSKRMADLDFGVRYESGGEDEIGQLGENFNVMSDKLESAVSDLKSANMRLQKDIDEKNQIDEMRKEFISNVSHELKTPIALIQGYAEGLKDNVNEDPESRDFYCDVIMDESAKMNKMVKQLLTLNQLEFGNDEARMERFDLTALIKGVLQASKLLIEQKEAKIIFDESKAFPVWGDEFKIEEVVTNYLTNALNHLDGEKVIDIRMKEENGIVTTTVFNTGERIPEEDLDKIWIKFFKVDKARTRAYGGSGIGLSIVKAIMDSHGQKCYAENYENGVAFSFTLESKIEL
ncbi:MAG: HAMP domain-containing sensor histidine kinase [Eubacterium sp.]|nr:HAMP domain-containing sensor histidine kinase [Eubacterium sp.]